MNESGFKLSVFVVLAAVTAVASVLQGKHIYK